jgi:lipopolysaccharide/colanic/teichoic acid biosynthesis glycosyltransferase
MSSRSSAPHVQEHRPASLLRERSLAVPRSTTPPRTGHAILKRTFDVTLSGVGLVASSPVWLILAAAVKLEDGGDVFYG